MGRHQLMGKKYTRFWPVFFLAPFFICFTAFNLYPVLYSFFISLTDWTGTSQRHFVGLENYIQILVRDINFRKSIVNTFFIIIVANTLTLIAGILLANFLFGLVKGRSLFQTINFLPYVTTPVALGLIFSFLFDWKQGVINKILTALGFSIESFYWLGNPRLAPWVIIFLIIWKYSGYYMAIFLAGLTGIPAELYEAAIMDGAGKATVFFRITIPMLRPIITFAAVTSLIGGFQLFDEPSIIFGVGAMGTPIFGGPDRSVLTIVWNFYDISFRNQFRFGYGAAVAFLLLLIIGIVSGLGNRFIGGKEDN
jgi:multiple sugar transport system permease protein/cellobiose transport system permease protein